MRIQSRVSIVALATLLLASTFFACSGSSGGGDDPPPPATCTLTVRNPATSDGSITVLPAQDSYEIGSTVVVTAVPARDRAFTGWFGSVTSAVNPVTIVMDADKTIGANFSASFGLTVGASVEGSGTVSVTPQKTGYSSGDTVSLTAVPSSGYEFTMWTGDLSGSANPATLAMTKTSTVTAVFSPIAPKHALTVVVSPAGAGTVNIASGQFAEGTVIPLSASANRGYRVSSWTCGAWSSTAANPSFTMPTSDATLTVSFEALPSLVISANASPSGRGSVSVSPATGPYYVGDRVTFSATPVSGAAFTAWSGASTATSSSVSVTLAGDTSITANFRGPRLTLAVTGGAVATIGKSAPGTVVSANVSEYDVGDSVILTAPTVAGYTFWRWTVGGTAVGYDPTYTVSMTGDKSVTAQYQKNTWTVLVYMDGDNNLETNAIQDLNEMESVDLRGSGINVIALLDRGQTAEAGMDDSSNGNWTGTRLFPVKYDSNGVDGTIVSGSVASSHLGLTANGNEELNMADPDTLTNFIAAGKSLAQADNYMIIFWDHGTGWRSKSYTTVEKPLAAARSVATRSITTGIKDAPASRTPVARPDGYRAVCADETSGDDMLYTTEIGAVLADKGMNVIGFDLCLGGMLEVAYELKGCGSYMIASPETTPADGWEYDLWLASFKAKTSKTGLELVKSVVDSYKTKYSAMEGACLAGYDLTKVQALMTCFDLAISETYLYILVGNVGDTNTVEQRKDIVKNALAYAEDYWNAPGDLNLDIGSLASALYNQAPQACGTTTLNALFTAVQNVVCYKWYNLYETSQASNKYGTGIAVHLTTLDSLGAVTPGMENIAYFQDHETFTTPPDNVPAFVDAATSWCPNSTSGTGLIWYLFFKTTF